MCPGECPPHLLTCQPSELNDWLCRLVLAVCCKDGKPYPPNTLHQLCCGLLRHVREVNPAVDFFQDAAFTSFRKTLDSEMKRIKATPGVVSAPKQADPILEWEEDILWQKGLLGSHTPQSLVDTMVFMAGLYFALCSGEEHRQLRFSLVQLVEKPGSIPYLPYVESTSKNNPGGLKHRKVTTKQVTHHANLKRPDRCFVDMFKKYCSHRPEKVKDDAFYLAPIPNAKGPVWYKNQAMGVNTLANTVKRLCQKAGITGHKTNHSLRVTAATRLFHEGLDEQLIMERTGHRSMDGVRAYERSCIQQQEEISCILNRKEPADLQVNKQLLPPAAFQVKIPLPVDLSTPSDEKENRSPQTKYSTPSLTLTGCTGITINY